MKIAFMAYDRPNYTGGPIINALRILPEFVNRGHTVLAIILFSEDCPNARILETKKVLVKSFNYTYTEISVVKILKILQEFEPDIFVPNISAQGGYASYWVKKAGIPTIITHRSPDIRNWCTAKTFGLKDWKWQCSGLICVSNYLKSECIKINNKINIDVIPSGVPIPVKKSNQNSEKLKIVYTGRLIQHEKRIWDIVNAFKYLAEKHNKFEFTLIGEGSDKDKIINFVKENNLQNQIVIKNKLTGNEYHEELIKHNIIVLLSDYEGTPGSIMDGMACGLVPICYNFNGIDELVIPQKTGIIVNNRTDEFYNAIDILYKNQQLKNELSINARNHIIQNYSLEKTVDKWECFFNLLLQKNKIKKQKIKIPEYLNLPEIPECYKNLGEDIRKPKENTLSFLKKLRKKLRLRTRIKAFLNG